MKKIKDIHLNIMENIINSSKIYKKEKLENEKEEEEVNKDDLKSEK